ncbi:hypothetical protein Pint_07904 [Pistacia integerrima]|uniref:Uncharacterized protein n=1 Tax=Pistacia integerrima TaxID=434235 RepID=A0ACC0XVB7_9ROSI|nr:hypothetical protein Pint_07904 [Pistacia integerrima]
MEEEDDGIMDYHSMKRKQLQALCKRHGVPANLSNSEMADLLCLIFKEKQKVVSRGKSSLKNSAKKVNGKDSKVVKKVRFSPKNQTMFFEVSGYKRAGRRRVSMKSLSKNQNQAIESEVSSPPPVGRKRARRDLKKPTAELSVKSAADTDGNGVRGVIVGEDAKLKKLNTGGRITRSRAQFVGEASESGEVHQLEKPCNVVGRDALTGKSAVTRKGRVGKESLSVDGAESDRVLQHKKPIVTKDEGSEMLPENSGIRRFSRRTRSQTKHEVAVSNAESETEEVTVQLVEPVRSLGRYASRRKSVVVQTAKVGSEGPGVKKETSKRLRSIDLEDSSELEVIIEPSQELEKVENVVIPSGPSRRTRRNKSTVPSSGELETRQTVGQKDTRLTIKLPRRSSWNVAEVAEPDEVLQQKEQDVTKDEDPEILSGTRKFKNISRMTRSQTETAGKASALESEIEEENVQHEEPSKGLGRYASRRKSIVHQKKMAENNEFQEKKETRKRSSNTDLERASEAVVELTKETEMVRNVSDFNGPSRRTRRNTVMFKSSASIDRELETHQIVGQEDALIKDHTRRSTRNASRNQSTVISSEVGGISHDVGKVRQLKRRREPALDEDISVTKSKSFEEKPQRRSARNASKNDLVEPERPTGKVAGKKHQNRSRKTMAVQEVPSSDKVLSPEDPIIEDVRLVGAESARNKDNLDASSSKQVLKSSSKKRNAFQIKVKANKKLGSVQVSTVNSDPEKAVDTAVNSEETLDSALVKQPDVSTDHVTLNSASSSTVVLEKQRSLVGDDKIEPLLDETVDKHEIKIDLGNVISSEITSPAAGLLPVKQSNDLAKPLNITDLNKVLAEEPSFGKNINHGSNNVDDHINEDDRASVQECQSLQLEDGEETSAAPVIQEAVFEDHLDEVSRSSSEKKSELPQEAEEINVIDPFNAGGSSQSENILQAIEIQELPAESHLVIIETATECTTEIQLTSPVANASEATSCKPALENEVFVKVNNRPADALIASNDAMEEVNKAETQSVSLLTVLEISNENGIRKEELSGKGIEFSDEIICRGETSIGNAICGLAKTEDGVTSNKNEPDEAVPYERASQVGEKSIDDGCEENLLVGGSSIFKTPNKDETNLEHEVAAAYSLDSVEKEKEDSGNNSDNVSVETRQRCMHKLSDAKDVNLTITEERVTDVLKKTSAANLNLQSPATAGKVSFPELSLLKSQDEHGKVSSSGSKSSSCKGKQSMLDDMPKQLEEKINEDARNVFETKVQSEYLPQFAIEELPEEGDMRDAHSTYGKVHDFVKSAELQVIADGSSGKSFPLDKSDAASGSELDGHVELAGERNCTVGIVVEQTADVVKEEKAESELKVELVNRSDQENVASQVNETASTSLTEIISKEREVPDEKAAEITVKPTECSGAVDDMKVEEFKAEDTNSNAEVNDVGALAQVVSNHLVEEEATESHEGSIEMIETAAEATTQALATKTMDFSDADNGETSIRICPVTDKTFRSEFEDVNDLAPGLMNEVTSANYKDVETRSNENVSAVPHIDKTKFDDLDNYKEENVLELERSASLSSDELISLDDRAADKEANVEDRDGNLNFRDNDIDAQQEDNVDNILQVTKSNMDDCLLRVGLYNASANIGVAADDAGEASMNEKACSQNIEDGNEWVGTPNFSQTIKSGTKWVEKNSAQRKLEMGSCSATAPHLSVLPFPGIDATDMDSHFEIDDQIKQKTRHEEDKEGSNDSVEGNEQLDDHKCELLETASIDENDSSTSKEPSCSNREKSIAKVGEEGVSTEKLFGMVANADTEKLYPISSSTPRMAADCSAFSPIIVHSNYGITENKSSGFHIDSPRLTSWEMNRILGSRDQVEVEEEAVRISGAMEMIENLVTDEQGEEGLHAHPAVLDEPISDNEESKEQNGLRASNQEYVDCEFEKDKFYVSAEKVVLVEAAATGDSVIADLDKSKAEYASVESKEADNIVVDPGVFNCSRSREVAMDIVHREASKTIDMLEEVEHLGILQPVED